MWRQWVDAIFVFAQSIEDEVGAAPTGDAPTTSEWKQRRQAMLQLHLSDQQFYCLVCCVLY